MNYPDNFEYESSEDENNPFNPYIDADYEPDDIPVPLNIYNQSPQSKPKPFKVYDVQLPTINYKDMPDLLANRIFDIAKRMSAPPEYAYTSTMVAISAAIGTKLGVRPKAIDDDYFICSTLWGLNIGDTGTKKTPVQHQCMQKLNSLNIELFEQCQKAISAFKKQKSKLEKQIVRIQNGHDSSDAMGGLIDQLQDLLDNEPVIESIVINDSTKEALQKDTGHSKNGILFERDEIGGLFEEMDASKNGYREYLLESWNGMLPRRSSRVGTGHNNVNRTFISILGGIQPDKLALFMKNGQPKYGSDGFIPRFQMAFLPTPSRREYKDEKGNVEYEEQLNDVIEFMFKWKPEDDPNYSSYRNNKNLLSISFDEEAQPIFAEWHQELDNRIFDKKDSARLRDHLNKYDALMGKIALDYHVIEHAPTGQIPAFISKQNTLRAISMCEILECHAKQLYEGFSKGGTEDTHLALELLEHLRDGTFKDGMTVSKMKRAKFGEEEPLKEALELLIEHGWLESNENTGSHRPSVQYSVPVYARKYLYNEKDYLVRVPATHQDRVWTNRLHKYESDSEFHNIISKYSNNAATTTKPIVVETPTFDLFPDRNLDEFEDEPEFDPMDLIKY